MRIPAGRRGLNRREWLRQAAALEAAAALLHAGAPASGVGAKSPPLDVPTVDGKTVAVHKQPGKVVLVDVMSTTCPSCKQAAQAIQALYREFGDNGFLAVGIAIDPQAANVLPIYRNLYGLTFPVGIAPREDVVRFLGYAADKPVYVPVLVLLDKDGRIAMQEVGWMGEAKLRAAVTGLLNRGETRTPAGQ